MSAGEDVEKRECKLRQPLWRRIWRFLKKKLGIKLLYDPAIPLLGIYPERTVTETHMHTCSQQHYLQQLGREATECPLTDEWVKKMGYLYSMQYYSAIKKKKKNESKSILVRWLNL